MKRSDIVAVKKYVLNTLMGERHAASNTAHIHIKASAIESVVR